MILCFDSVLIQYFFFFYVSSYFCRPTSLAWEVRKMSPGRHVMSSPSSDRIVPSPGVRRALNFGQDNPVTSNTPRITQKHFPQVFTSTSSPILALVYSYMLSIFPVDTHCEKMQLIMRCIGKILLYRNYIQYVLNQLLQQKLIHDVQYIESDFSTYIILIVQKIQ